MLIKNSEFQPICSFIFPLQPSRFLETPSHALRFVSLIPLSEKRKIDFYFNSYHAIFTQKNASISEKSALLCSLLLGFGINAYVAVGTALDNDHIFVLTMTKKFEEITIWEPITGEKFQISDPLCAARYQTINCLFNNSEFYANIQLDDRISKTSFEILNLKYWKSLDKEKIELLLPWFLPIKFQNPVFETYKLEQEIEQNIVDLIGKIRNEKKINENEKLKNILQIPVSSYEYERLFKICICENEFKDAINRILPKNYSYKAFPIQFTEINSQKIFNKIYENPVFFLYS